MKHRFLCWLVGSVLTAPFMVLVFWTGDPLKAAVATILFYLYLLVPALTEDDDAPTRIPGCPG
jgi:hypothetical protein